MLGIEPGCPSAPLGVRDERIDQDLGESQDAPRRRSGYGMGGLAKIKSQYYRHVGRGLLHKPAAYFE